MPDGVPTMLTIQGRDESWSHRAMAELFAEAVKRNLQPHLWRVGYFVLRDLVKTVDPLMKHKPRLNRPQTVWGCPIETIMLSDHVELVAVDARGKGQTFTVEA